VPLRLNVRMEIPGKDTREFLYEFDQQIVTMGRDSRNDIQIPLTTVSRTHAQIIHEGGEYFIEDLRSTHGTIHNHKPLGQGGKKLLRDGDIVQVMHFKISYQRVAEKPLEFASSEKTEQLARRMVQEVLASMGDATEQPYLRVMNGPDEGKRFELTEAIAEVVVGRGSDCDLVINDANISRRHAIVRKDWGGITIEDLGSKNGVVINDKKIEGAVAMQDSDEIMLGAVRLTFIDPTASFLGSLDGIPAFDDQETVAGDSPDDDEDEDEYEYEEEEEEGEEEEEESGEGGEEAMDPGLEGASDLAPDAGSDIAAGPDGTSFPGDLSSELTEGAEAAAGDEDAAGVPSPAGRTEIIILVVVLVVVLGLAGGLAWYLLFSSS